MSSLRHCSATFVMVSMSMIKNEGIAVNLPLARTGTPQERNIFTTVSVARNGGVYLNKREISVVALPGLLQEMKSENPGVRIFIQADHEALFGAAIRVLDEVRRAGITRVAIQTTDYETGPGEGAAKK